jgi:hypothetical protein
LLLDTHKVSHFASLAIIKYKDVIEANSAAFMSLEDTIASDGIFLKYGDERSHAIRWKSSYKWLERGPKNPKHRRTRM